MISFWCSSKNVTVCSTSRANLSVLSSLRVILATKTSGVFWNSYVNTTGWSEIRQALQGLPVLPLAHDEVGHQIPVKLLDHVRIEILFFRPAPPLPEHRRLAIRRRHGLFALLKPGRRMDVTCPLADQCHDGSVDPVDLGADLVERAALGWSFHTV